VAVTASDVKSLPSGEFAAVADAVVEGFIAEAQRDISSTAWGTRYDDGVLYLSAHLLAVIMGGGVGVSGPVVSETAGPVSRSYAGPIGLAAESLATTVYGRRYLQILHTLGLGPVVL